MPDSTGIAIGAYLGLSLGIGIACVLYEVLHRPVMLDRADGQGKFPSPKMKSGELIFFGLFVALAWPIVAAGAIRDMLKE